MVALASIRAHESAGAMPRPTELERTPMAQAIRRFRTTLGDTQHQFAERMGVTLTSIARYETNSRPSRAVLAKLAAIAQEANQPLFVEIFTGRIEPQPTEFEAQELLGAVSLLKLALDVLGRSR